MHSVCFRMALPRPQACRSYLFSVGLLDLPLLSSPSPPSPFPFYFKCVHAYGTVLRRPLRIFLLEGYRSLFRFNLFTVRFKMYVFKKYIISSITRYAYMYKHMRICRKDFTRVIYFKNENSIYLRTFGHLHLKCDRKRNIPYLL